ncbi:DUF362 domain-containing protein [Candidatus Fermentibacteria bacterium]|nr:DUF362 domain-containing protein [Candidatus Fermentibacteria bacterium]
MSASSRNEDRLRRGISRRRFIQTAAMAAAGATIPVRNWGEPTRSGNVMPGKIVIWEDLGASSGTSVNLVTVKTMVENGLMALTGQPTALSALESLLPGLDVTKRVTFKVNCLGTYVPTRWEMVRAVTDLLRQTCGSLYPPANITIFDNRGIGSFGFNSTNFPDVTIASGANVDPTTTIEIAPGVTVKLSSHIVNCDYLINCPVLKDHGQSDKRWTLAFKNHIGSVYGSSSDGTNCHAPNPRLLNISASPHVKEKTKLILTSAIYGVWNGGPNPGGPSSWSLFPEELRPNSIMLSTDPVTLEHWGIELINRERASQGYPVYSLPYCQDAAGPPWYLGVYDFAQHEVITNLPEPASLEAQPGAMGGVQLSWPAVSGAAKYRVYRSTNPYFTPDPFGGSNLLGETTATSYADPAAGVDPSTNYYYIVRAYRAIWESPDSPRVGAFAFALP